MAFSLALNVDADQLDSQATQMSETVQRIERALSNLQQELAGTQYWKGTAADNHRQDLSGREQAISDLVKRLKQYPDDVRKMAGIYRGAEDSNVTAASQLKTSVELV